MVQDPSQLTDRGGRAGFDDRAVADTPAHGSLAFTGGRATDMGLLAIILLLSGSATYWFARRRRLI